MRLRGAEPSGHTLASLHFRHHDQSPPVASMANSSLLPCDAFDPPSFLNTPCHACSDAALLLGRWREASSIYEKQARSKLYRSQAPRILWSLLLIVFLGPAVPDICLEAQWRAGQLHGSGKGQVPIGRQGRQDFLGLHRRSGVRVSEELSVVLCIFKLSRGKGCPGQGQVTVGHRRPGVRVGEVPIVLM